MLRNSRLTAVVAAAFFLQPWSLGQAEVTQTFTVDCSSGQTISSALEQGDSRKPMVLLIRGTCQENVLITRDHVTLQGDASTGATVTAADPNTGTLQIRGTWVVIDGLSIVGGVNGIGVIGSSHVLVRNSNIRNAAQSGINVRNGYARLLGNVVENNGADGLTLISAGASGSNNQIRQNSIAGVRGSKRSNIDISGTTIAFNGSDGVVIDSFSAGEFSNVTITDNSGNGIYVGGGSVSVDGSALARNQGCGLYGDFATVNVSGGTVTNNSACGVFVYLGSIVTVLQVVISNNVDFGLGVRANSTAHIDGVTIRNNTGDGIFLQAGSKLLTQPPLSNDLTANGGWGLQCTDRESSVESTGLLNGTISSTCTGF